MVTSDRDKRKPLFIEVILARGLGCKFEMPDHIKHVHLCVSQGTVSNVELCNESDSGDEEHVTNLVLPRATGDTIEPEPENDSVGEERPFTAFSIADEPSLGRECFIASFPLVGLVIS